MSESKHEGNENLSMDDLIALAEKADQECKRIAEAYRKSDLAKGIEALPEMAQRITTAILGPNAESVSGFVHRPLPSRVWGTMSRSPRVDIEIMRRSYEERLQAKDERIQELEIEIEHLNDLLTIREIEERSG